MSREYAVLAVLAAVTVVVGELTWVRSGVFGDRGYRITMAICLFFMVLVNGWLTKLSDPIVLYAAAEKTPWRFPWDIPVEDYAFGFAMLTAVLMRWRVLGRRLEARPSVPTVAP